MSEKIPTLVIDCEKWARGRREDEFGKTKLLNPEGNMCCLGFDCLQNRGALKSEMLGMAYPIGGLSRIAIDNTAISINDDPRLTDAERIKKLRKLLRGKRKLIFRNKPQGVR